MKTLNLDIYNKNLEACLKEVSNIGHTVYVNVCDDTEKIVSWGTFDWIFAFLLLLTVCALIYAIIRILNY